MKDFMLSAYSALRPHHGQHSVKDMGYSANSKIRVLASALFELC